LLNCCKLIDGGSLISVKDKREERCDVCVEGEKCWRGKEVLLNLLTFNVWHSLTPGLLWLAVVVTLIEPDSTPMFNLGMEMGYIFMQMENTLFPSSTISNYYLGSFTFHTRKYSLANNRLIENFLFFSFIFIIFFNNIKIYI
jgi:hypothetical protein